jgi:hexosaminidase
VARLPGHFQLNAATRIKASRDVWKIGQYLQEFLQPATGYALVLDDLTESNPHPDESVLTTIKSKEIPDGGAYQLDVTPQAIVARAAEPVGIFYALQTLRQLLPADIESYHRVRNCRWAIPCVHILDYPRFSWRGMMLDTARFMYPVECIKKFIDLLAFHKMNVFHWHLTDDQGWRIEIKKYPRLTEIGAYRQASPIPAEPGKADGIPYGGFYTQEQIREVVAHAAGRFVTVVPEIDMPGHSLAALASYPELGCLGGPYVVRSRWGIEKDIYCAGSEKVYVFLEDVLTEVLDLFPGHVLHIGGDEVPKERWRQCPRCQALMKKQALKDEEELQGYFVQRMEKFLKARGRQLIGWDEIIDGGLPPHAMVMSWRGMEGGVKAAASGHSVVMCPTHHCYFDYRQSLNKEDEPPAIGDETLLLEQVYAFDPIPQGMPAQAAGYILGTQGNVWTEYIPTYRQVEYMAYPRASALAEVAWCPPDTRDFKGFMQRLSGLLRHLDILGVNYRNPW